MVRQTARVLFFEIIGGILFLAVLAAALFAWRLSQGPVQLDAFKDDIEAALTSARDGRAVELASVALEWSPEARQVTVTAYGLTFLNRAGEEAGTAHRAELLLDASALLLGEAEILAMALTRGGLQVVETGPGQWSVAGEPLPPIPAGTLPDTPAGWVDLVERVMAGVMAGGQGALPDMRLETIAFEDFTIDVMLASGARLMQVADAEGELARTEEDLRLSLSGRGVGEGLPRGIALDVRSAGGFSELVGEVAFAGWTVADLAGRMGIAPDRASGLPADMAFTFEITEPDGLTGFSAELNSGGGQVRIAGRDYPLTRLEGRLDYDPVADVAALAVERLEADALSGSFRLQLDEAVRPETLSRPISFTADTLALDLTPMFAVPFQFDDLRIEGTADLTAHSLDAETLSTRIGRARLRGSGAIARNRDIEPGQLPLNIDLNAAIEGPLDIDTVTDFWPVRLGAGARRFAVRNIEAGTVTAADVELRVRADSLAEGHLRDSDLEVAFTATDARVRFLSDMPAVDRAAGTGRLTGNGFSVDLAAGTFGSWQLSGGTVALARFMPKGDDLVITATGEGPAPDMLNYIFNSRLNLEEETGFDPDRVSGLATAELELSRPALDDVPAEDIRFDATARVVDGGLKDLGAGFDLTNARARVDIDETVVRVTGNGDVGPANVTFAWRDGFGDEDEAEEGSTLNARAVVTPDILNAFGLLGRPYLSGEIPVDLTASLGGNEFRTADVDLDLTGARVDLAEIGWLKPPGDPARALIKYDFTGPSQIASADLQSETAGLSGDIMLGPDGRLITFDLRRAYLADRADVSGRLAREADGSVALNLEGPFLDVSPLIGDLGAMGGAGGAGAGAGGTAVRLSAEVETLRFGLGRDLLGASLDAVSDAGGLAALRASGTTDAGDPLDVSYQRDGGGAEVSLVGEDAGFLVAALFGLQVIDEGRVELTGRLESGDVPSRLLLTLRDARLMEAPIITQLLSLASLRGLVDTLGGEGVLFSEIMVPLQIAEGRYIVTGGRASGPALGLTINGWVEPETGGIEVSGVLVPSFGVNSALGGIPIIGDLFVGRDGEGILSLTYSIRGSLDRAQVAVNPLSAVAPGVLRRIFENPANTELPLPDTGDTDTDGAGE